MIVERSKIDGNCAMGLKSTVKRSDRPRTSPPALTLFHTALALFHKIAQIHTHTLAQIERPA